MILHVVPSMCLNSSCLALLSPFRTLDRRSHHSEHLSICSSRLVLRYSAVSVQNSYRVILHMTGEDSRN